MSNYLDFGIFLYLSDGKIYTADFLADKFEVCKKTIYRHVNNLIFAGVPITTSSGKTGGIKLTSTQTYNLHNFSIDEVNYLQKLLANHKSNSTLTSKLINAKLDSFLNSITNTS